MEKISDKTFEEQVYQKVESLREHWPNEKEFAAFFNMSTRTMRRRLGEFGAIFRHLIIERKQELAREYLANSTESLSA